MPSCTECEVAVIRETAAAFLLCAEGEEVWVPKSVVVDPDDFDVDPDSEVTMNIASWFVEKNFS